MQLAAYLDPDAIPLDPLAQAAQDEEVQWPDPVLRDTLTHPLRLDAAVERLRDFSLVSRAGENMSVHCLVQAVTRHALPEADRRAWAACATVLVNAAFPSGIQDDLNTWPICDRLLAHAQAAADHAEELGVAGEQTDRLLNQVGLHLKGRARYTEARAAFARALAIDETVYGPDHPEVAIDVNNLGSVLRDLGDLPAARAALERALAIFERVLGPDHPNTRTVRGNLAALGPEGKGR